MNGEMQGEMKGDRKDNWGNHSSRSSSKRGKEGGLVMCALFGTMLPPRKGTSAVAATMDGVFDAKCATLRDLRMRARHG